MEFKHRLTVGVDFLSLSELKKFLLGNGGALKRVYPFTQKLYISSGCYTTHMTKFELSNSGESKPSYPESCPYCELIQESYRKGLALNIAGMEERINKHLKDVHGLEV